MANLKLVGDAMFLKKENWVNVPDSEKESCFFIFNRYFSKKYPEKSKLLNKKGIDKVSAMDIWYTFMLDKPYPSWFWGSKKVEKTESLKKTDKELLIKSLGVKSEDIDYLFDNFKDLLNEELKYLNKLQKQ